MPPALLPRTSDRTRTLSVRTALGALVLATIVPVTGGVPAAAAEPACGPYVDDVHQITTADQIAAIGLGALNADCGPNRNYRLMNNITVTGASAAVNERVLQGTFDGNGRTITLDVDNTSDNTAAVGLFEYLNGATITDLTLAGSVRTAGSGPAGALAGQAVGTVTITGVKSTVDVSGRADVGGLVGRAEALVLDDVEVGTGANAVELRGVRQVGGLVGTADQVDVGIASVNVRILPQSFTGMSSATFGGIVGAAQTALTVDGSAAGAPLDFVSYGVSVRLELLVPDGPAATEIGGIAGRMPFSGTPLIRGAYVELDVESSGELIGGIAGVMPSAATTSIGGSEPEHAIVVTGSIVGGASIGGRVGGIAPFHYAGAGSTSVQNLSMAASLSANDLGGLFAGVNGTLSIQNVNVSGRLEGVLSAGGIAGSISSATVTLRDILIISDIRADQVGGIADSAADLTIEITRVDVIGTLRPRPAETDGFRSVGGLFSVLFGDVVFPVPPMFGVDGARIEVSFPEGLPVGNAFLLIAGLVASLGNTVDAAALSGAPAELRIDVSAAMRDSGRCIVASRFIRSAGFGQTERIDPLSPDPCPPIVGTTTSGTGNSSSTPELACTWERLAVGAQVTCEVSDGPSGTELLWHAVVNPVVAGGSVLVNGTGIGTFSFVVPRAALGLPLFVELVEWREPMLLGTVTGVVPTSVPAGEGPWQPGGQVLSLVGLLALLALGGLGRRWASRPAVTPS
jgi:hypothetical protein